MSEDDWYFENIFTRTLMIEVKILIEIDDKLLKESGIKIPSVFSDTLFDGILKNDDPNIERTNQLTLLKEISQRIERTDTYTIQFKKNVGNFIYDILVVIGPDDYGRKCLTIGCPEDFEFIPGYDGES